MPVGAGLPAKGPAQFVEMHHFFDGLYDSDSRYRPRLAHHRLWRGTPDRPWLRVRGVGLHPHRQR
ncbi:hypothetical protein METHP15_560014 [Pseudomonas sp. P15-2025]